ncbi:MAG TPA: hypothetical protein VJP79_12755 [Nitrososphaera sp.]|nr:hypothetical protein [Nitrososphaera sp.]
MPLVFYDKLSESLHRELPETASVALKAFINVGQFDVAQSYVTAKVENRFGDSVKINIEGGRHGIELQDTLFKLDGRRPKYAYLVTRMIENDRVIVRKLPVLGVKDWLLIYEDDLFLLAVKDAYDELDIRLVE